VRRLAEVARRLDPLDGARLRADLDDVADPWAHLRARPAAAAPAEVEARYDPIPVDAAARAFGEMVSAARRSGRQPRRQSDLLIAAVTLAHRLALATRHPVDCAGLDDLVEVHAV
jgi:predicted nucleic acid-binding protein